MPEFSEIVQTALEGIAAATDKQELARLLAHVQAVNDLTNKQPSTDELIKLLKSGYLPDYNQAVRATMTAQLAMNTERKRTVDGGGAVAFGPVQLKGDFASSLDQTTGTNISVTIELERTLVSQSFAALLKPFGDSGVG